MILNCKDLAHVSSLRRRGSEAQLVRFVIPIKSGFANHSLVRNLTYSYDGSPMGVALDSRKHDLWLFRLSCSGRIYHLVRICIRRLIMRCQPVLMQQTLLCKSLRTALWREQSRLVPREIQRVRTIQRGEQRSPKKARSTSSQNVSEEIDALTC